VPQDSLHLDQIHDTLEVLLSTDRNLDHDRVSTQDVLHLLHSLEEVSAGAVHLVDIADTGNIVFVSLTPHCLALRLHTVSSGISSDGTIQHTQ